MSKGDAMVLAAAALFDVVESGLPPRVKRADYIAAVRSCVGTRVGHHGRVIGGALDCVGVPWAAAVACGLSLAATPRYPKRPTGEELTRGLAMFCSPTDDPSRAHLLQVVFDGKPRHVVVPVGANDAGQTLVVHAWFKNRRVQETLLTHPVAAYWRIPGVE